MFTLLLIIGSFLIILGIVKIKRQPDNSLLDIGSNFSNSMELHELRERIDHIENTLFFDIVKLLGEDNVEEIEEIEETKEINSSNSALEKFTLLCQYEKQNFGIEEICILLNMKKGEVLLLKNLYKTLLV